MIAPPSSSARGINGAVASADQLATNAGATVLANGGNAVDAAIATNAVMAVVGPQLCGVGGDLLALVHHDGVTHALNASGHAGSGSDPAVLRAEGFGVMPFQNDIRSVTVPGCVDGWIALHSRFGSVDLATLLAPAIMLASTGFPASSPLSASYGRVSERGRQQLDSLAAASKPGALVTRPGLGEALRAVAAEGRSGFYEGRFGEGLLTLGGDLFCSADLERSQADWVEPLTTDVWGIEMSTIPPNSQGYLTLGASRLAAALELPDDPDDPQWAHLLIECATAAGYDRPDRLHEGADGDALLATIDGRIGMVDPLSASSRLSPTVEGDTTYLCTVDSNGMGVSLIQSNAAGFGSWLVEPNTRINLHNRGIGFCLVPGHPAELQPGRRPPHTLCPAITTRGGDLAAVFGTMGGDAQPQVLLQLAARMFHHRQSPNRAVRAGRWALRGAASGFDTWTSEPPTVQVEGNAPSAWAADLAARGHRVVELPPFDSAFGHAHAIVVEPNGVLAAAADPRTVVGSSAAI